MTQLMVTLRHFGYSLSKDWYVEFVHNGQRKRVKNGTTYGLHGNGNTYKTKTQRIDYFVRLQTAIQYYYANHKPITNPALQDTINQFITTKRKELRSDTISDYKTRLTKFSSKFQNYTLQEVQKATIVQFLDTLTCSHTHYNNYIKILKLFFNYCIEIDVLAQNPVSGIRKRTGDTRTNVAYTITDAKRILDVLKQESPHLWLCCLLEYYAFLRPSEIRSLCWSDVDFVNGYISIQSSSSKTKQARTIPLHQDLVSAFQYFGVKNVGYIFVFSNGKHVAKDYLKHKFQQLKSHLRVNNGCTLYSFKHTGCSELYKKTKDIHLVSRLCGHKSILVTQVYLRSLNLNLSFDDVDGITSLM